MKKLILAVVLYAVSVGLASAANVSATDSAYRGDLGPAGLPLFVRGLDGDWGTVNPMTYDAGSQTYSALISLTALSHEFKIADADWDNASWSSGGAFDLTSAASQTLLIGDSIFGGPNATLDLATGGLYLFSLDVSNWTDARASYELTISQVPIPAAGLLLLSAIGGLGFFRRK